MQLNIGDTVLVHLEPRGVFHAKVDRFESAGHVAVLMPTREPVRDVFPDGYNLGCAHWEARLTKLTGEPVTAGSAEDQLANSDGTPKV
jgi:hypothetical protein